MPATLQPVIVTPSLPLLLAFYKALFGAVETSRVPTSRIPTETRSTSPSPSRGAVAVRLVPVVSSTPSVTRGTQCPPSSTGPYRMNTATMP
jgi:hypothetical protein